PVPARCPVAAGPMLCLATVRSRKAQLWAQSAREGATGFGKVLLALEQLWQQLPYPRPADASLLRQRRRWGGSNARSPGAWRLPSGFPPVHLAGCRTASAHAPHCVFTVVGSSRQV